MILDRARSRAAERISNICDARLDTSALRREILDVLTESMGSDAYVWLLTDPVTTVGAAPLAAVPSRPELPATIRSKYLTGINRWTELIAAPSPAGLLHRDTGGELGISTQWSEVLCRYQIGDVASTVFADQFGCWGFLDLWRRDDRVPFTASDAEFLAAVAAPVTVALRESQSRTFVEPAAARAAIGPVVLTLDDELRILSRTAASQEWLEILLPPEPESAPIPASVYNVAAQLLAVEAGIDAHPASARTHLRDGFWITLRAARMDSTQAPGPGGVVVKPQIAVTIEAASSEERLDMFARSFALTKRETQLLGVLAAGGDTRTMARRLRLSEYTVQDHFKSVFAKTGAADRISLLARALGTRPGIT